MTHNYFATGRRKSAHFYSNCIFEYGISCFLILLRIPAANQTIFQTLHVRAALIHNVYDSCFIQLILLLDFSTNKKPQFFVSFSALLVFRKFGRRDNFVRNNKKEKFAPKQKFPDGKLQCRRVSRKTIPS